MFAHTMRFQYIQSLKRTMTELIAPVETVQGQMYEEDGRVMPTGVELIMGELTTVALIMINADLDISRKEIDLLNNFRQAVYGDKYVALAAENYNELCQKFLSMYPSRCLSIDSTPYTVQYLQTYDREHGTDFADKAKAMFLQLAVTIASADGRKDREEHIVLRNFKEVLYPQNQ